MLTTLTPAASHRLTTLDAVKAELKIEDANSDAWLDALIDQASAAIAAWCGRTFAKETVRETIHVGVPHSVMILARHPVLSVEALAFNGVTLNPSQVEIGEAGLLHRVDDNGARIAWLPGRYAIDYESGFVLPGETGRTLPADIERAAIIAVNNLHHARGRNHAQKVSEVEGIGRMVFETGDFGFTAGISADVRSLLSAHCEAVFR